MGSDRLGRPTRGPPMPQVYALTCPPFTSVTLSRWTSNPWRTTCCGAHNAALNTRSNRPPQPSQALTRQDPHLSVTAIANDARQVQLAHDHGDARNKQQ
eukprot:1195733-Prorocentrum_minimum.AAC.8